MRLRVTDNEGVTNNDVSSVVVSNVAPAVDAGPDRNASPGTPVVVIAGFADPGLQDTHSCSIDWGDGAGATGSVDEAAGTCTGGHTFANPGTHTVTVTVTDDDGGVGQDSALLTVTGGD